MNRIMAFGLAVSAMVLTAAAEPPRSLELNIASATSQTELSACIIRRVESLGRASSVPIENGMAVDWIIGGGPGPYDPRFTVEIRDIEGSRHLSASYRHPLSRGAALKMVRDLVQRCSPASVDQVPAK